MSSSFPMGPGVKMAILVMLMAIVFLVFAVYYSRYRNQVQHSNALGHSSKQKSLQGSIRGVVIAAFTFLVLLVVTLLLTFFAVLGLRKIEQKNLFVPTTLDRYRLLSGVVYSLPSGALLLNTTPNASPQTRRILFLHGNTGNLELYREALDKMVENKYNLFALEYRGYGPAPNPVGLPGPTAETIEQDAIEAWNQMGTSDGIVVGFSIGGAILAQVYEKFLPQPAQIVFLNSFGDLKALMEDKLGNDFGNAITPLLQTKFAVKSPTTYDGKVLVVFTADDLTVPKVHGERLCTVFSKSDLTCRELPRGGHKFSTFSYFQHWSQELLPPQVDG